MHKIFKMSFGSIYKLYIAKVGRKNRTQEEIDAVIFWLTGYNKLDLQQILDNQVNFADFFDQAPNFNSNAHLITGSICGHKISEISDPLMQKIRYLDKLVDEIAKGKPMHKILKSEM